MEKKQLNRKKPLTLREKLSFKHISQRKETARTSFAQTQRKITKEAHKLEGR